MKIRSDSLYAKLAPAQREELLHALIVEAKSYDWAVDKCEEWNVSTSPSGLSALLSRHGIRWRIERAKVAAKASEKTLPKNHEEATRRGLAQREFELAFDDLSVKELVALKRLQLAQAKIELDSRKLAILEAKQQEAEKTLADPDLSPAEKEAKMREVFGLQ